MSTLSAATLGLLLLGALGLLPAVALVGWRWLSLVLAPVGGAVLTGLAAALALALGGPLVGWAWLLGTIGGGLSVAWWIWRPDGRPWRTPVPHPERDRARSLILVSGGILSLLAAALSLRGLATPTVGFDTRALWALRAGWMLHDHHQMLLDFRVRELLIGQSGYPPLVSSESAFVWGMTGLHTVRVEVVIVALVDVLCLLALSMGIMAAGRAAIDSQTTGARRRLPVAVAALVGPAIILVGAGITEPFLTNGYADPMWSLCAAGAVLFGLALPSTCANFAAAALLLVGAGMSKQEGMFTALCLLGLILARQLGHLPAPPHRRRRVVILVAAAGAQVAAMAAWPLAIALTGSRQVSSPLSPTSTWHHRTHAVLTGFAPSLHVLVLALGLSLVGGLMLRGTRRDLQLGNDLWSWAGLLAGLGGVSAVLVTGSAAIVPWIEGSVHRVTQFPAVTGWLIVAVWVVTGAAAASGGHPGEPNAPQQDT